MAPEADSLVRVLFAPPLVCVQVMMVSFGKFNRERVKILEGGEWISGGDLSDEYLAKLKTK
jgi:hypothetical protein